MDPLLATFVSTMNPMWHTYLSRGAKNALESQVAALNAETAPWLPEPPRVMRALEMPPTAVKVLIIGQDPYPTPGNACGLSFSVNPGVAIPKSLHNIYTELVTDLGVAMPTTGDLTPWFNQGVMLLNRSLSVVANKAGSHHTKNWETFTDGVIDALLNVRAQHPSNTPPPMVVVLWGRDARSLAPRFEDAPNVSIIESAHPSPLSAYRGFFGSKPFSRINDYLTANGDTEIIWSLS